MSDRRDIDEQTRRRIRRTVIVLAIVAAAFYVSAFFRLPG